MQSYRAVSSGNWSSPAATWDKGAVPPFTLTSRDEVNVDAGLIITMDNTVTLNAYSARLNLNGKLISLSNSLIITSGSLSGSGTININNLILDSACNFSFLGLLVVNTLTDSIASLNSSALMEINNTLNLAGAIIIQPSGSLKMGINSAINIQGGSLAVNGGKLKLNNTYNVAYMAPSVIGMELSGSGLKDVIIKMPATGHVVLSSDIKINNSLNIISGSLVLDGHTLTLNGQVTGSGTFSGDPDANFIINTPGSLFSGISFAPGYQSLHNFIINEDSGKAVTLASSLVVNGALELLNGSKLDIKGEALTLNGTYSGTGSFLVNSQSALAINGKTSITSPLVFSDGNIGNFTLNIGDKNSIVSGHNMIVDTLNLVTGTLILNGHNLSINADIVASGNGKIFSESPSSISVTSSSSTSGTLAFSNSGDTVNDFNVSIGSSGAVMLGSDIVITGILNLITGHINTASNNLQIASSGSILGANTNAYVITSEGGYLTRDAAISVTEGFPVGTATYYSPASITLNVGSSTGVIGVNVMPGVYSQATNGTLLSASQPVVNSTWSFQTNITSGLNADMQLFWPAAIESNGFTKTGDFISHYEAGSWDNVGSSSNTYQVAGGFGILRKGITSMSHFAVFDKKTIGGLNEIAAKERGL